MQVQVLCNAATPFSQQTCWLKVRSSWWAVSSVPIQWPSALWLITYLPGLLNVSSVEECAPIAASKHHCQATIATMEGAHCCYYSQDDTMYHPKLSTTTLDNQHVEYQVFLCSDSISSESIHRIENILTLIVRAKYQMESHIDVDYGEILKMLFS